MFSPTITFVTTCDRRTHHRARRVRRRSPKTSGAHFPDLEWRVDLVLSEGDLVAARWTAAGTHRGGWGDVPATGRAVTFSGVNIFRFGTEGKVVEIWNHRDDLGLIEQLGASVFAGAAPSEIAEPT